MSAVTLRGLGKDFSIDLIEKRNARDHFKYNFPYSESSSCKQFKKIELPENALALASMNCSTSFYEHSACS